MDPDPDSDPDPAIFVIDLQDANKNNFFMKFFCLLHFEGTYITFQRQKFKKKSQNIRKQGISYYFCLMIRIHGTSD